MGHLPRSLPPLPLRHAGAGSAPRGPLPPAAALAVPPFGGPSVGVTSAEAATESLRAARQSQAPAASGRGGRDSGLAVAAGRQKPQEMSIS